MLVKLHSQKTKNLFLLFFLLLTVSFANAANRFSVASGNWSSTAVWSATLGGAPGASAPTTGDVVTIAGGFTVTSVGTVTVASVTVNAGSTLNQNSRNLTVTGFFTNNGTVTVSSGRILPAGDFTNTGTVTYSAAGRLYLGGNYTNSGTVTLGSALVYFTGSANQTIQGFTTTGTVRSDKTGGMATFTGNVSGGGFTLNGAGTLNLGTGLTHTFTGNWARTNGTLNCGSSTLKIGTNVTGAAGTFIAGTGTVEYNGNRNQAAAVLTYNNLTLSGTSGTRVKTFETTPTVNGKLTIAGTATVTITGSGVVTYGPNATLQYDTSAARIITSEEWISPFNASGGVLINGTNNITLNTAKVFGLNSPLTITGTGKLVTNNLGLTFGGNFVIDSGGTFMAGSSPIVITNTGTQNIAGFTTTGLVSMTKTAGTATFVSDVNAVGLTVNGAGGTLNLGTALNHTLTGAVTLTSGTLNGGSSMLNVNFAGTAWAGTGTNFARGTGTVNFGGLAQTLTAVSTFNNLTVSNSGLKTVAAGTTVNGILSMEGAATVSAAPIYGTAATLQYNTATPRNSDVEWITPFNATGGVSIINTGIITVATAKTCALLNIADDATLNNGNVAILGTTLNLADGGTLLVSGTSTFPVFTTNNLGLTSVVNYNGTAQTVAVKNYGFLTLSGSGIKTFAGATTIREDFSIGAGVTALFPNGTTSSAESLYLNSVLQTTLGSYGGTASAATTKDATWFGTTTTGILNVTSSCISGTWLGTTNTDWGTASNWCGGVIPSATTNVIIGASSNQPIIGASGGICRNITINSGSTLTISGSNVLQVRGNWINNGTFIPNSSIVNFNGTVAQSIGGTATITFATLNNTNTTAIVTATKAIAVNNGLTVATNAVLDMTTFALAGAFINSGAGQIRTASTTALPLPTGKTWTNTILYSSLTGGQTIVAGTYNGTPSVELDNTSGTQTASGNIVTGGQLNINTGGSSTFNLDNYNLTTNSLNVLDSNSVLDMGTGTLTITTVQAMEGKVRFSGATNGKAFASGTVEYYGTAQTVTAGDYFKLLFTGASGVYTIGANLDVASTLIITNGVVTVQDGFTVSVDDAVTVTSPGTLIFENNASLLQTTYTGANTGNVVIKRNTTPILKLDSTFWSSPTTGTQTLSNFSPNTDTSQFYTFNSVINNYETQNPATAVFEKGVGYSIRAPETASTVTPTVTPFQFVGVPNNGPFTLAVTTPPGDVGLSLIGNPYPSAINAEDFINENLYDAVLNPTNVLEGTLYFWTHNNRLIGTDFSSSDYASRNLSGFNAGNSGTGNDEVPTDYIASGQGFFVQNDIAGNLKFNNTMRESNNNTNFYKTKKGNKIKEIERHRVWLDLKNSSTKSSQILIAYVENATNNYEGGYDSYVFDADLPFLLYSLLGTNKMGIQGRALPFSDADIIPLGYKMDLAGSTNISINNMDGLFLEEQGIYLEDKDLNVIHDLKEEPYVFNSTVGTFENRFVLRYTSSNLGTDTFNSLKNRVLVSNKNKQIKINSFAETIEKVAIYDLSGKQIFQKEGVDTNEFVIANLASNRQVIMVKTTLQNGTIVTNKIVF
ncbi:T9SS sorting signal type C domain-containing protein [Flavobacterium eburneipallidum]|uniref:T9SS sorting signal type C domain-containing protein n=1 Tax=Flavobacterium eburneipallidum TaxID=3003263 RepID=UPI0024828336|nr:T9SS sorting signal type C domain-containing protein [Flavobacterium eburneipallidum]